MAVKDALQMAFEGVGGADRLTVWAKANETEFYKLWAKMLPTEIKGDITVNVGLAAALDEAKKRRARPDS